MNHLIEIIAEQLKQHRDFSRLWKPRVLKAKVEEAWRDPALGLGWIKVKLPHPDTGQTIEYNDVPWAHEPGTLPALPEKGDEVLLFFVDRAPSPVYAMAVRKMTDPEDRAAPGEEHPRGLI